MTAYFYDTEFLDDGERIHLISIGIISEYGDTYYAVNCDMPIHQINGHEFLMNHVVPHLPINYNYEFNSENINEVNENFKLDESDSCVKPKESIRDEVFHFIRPEDDESGDKVDLYAWYSAYDHVVLAQLWGPMMNLPRHIPMYTRDLKCISDLRPKFELPTSEDIADKYDLRVHHALDDAKIDLVRAQYLGVINEKRRF